MLLRLVVVDPASFRFPKCPTLHSCWVPITGVLLMLNLLVGDMPERGELFLQTGSETLHGHSYMCTHNIASAHKYSPHMHSYGEQTGRVLYASYTCVHLYICVCGIDFPGPHAPGCLYIRAW